MEPNFKELGSQATYEKVESLDCSVKHPEEVARVLLEGRPVHLKNCRFGSCLENWSLTYLAEKLNDYEVVIHESDQPELNFMNKNFKYSTCKFQEFVNKLQDPSRCVYYRSANVDPRAKKPARIEDDLRPLKDDLEPPCFVPSNESLYYSSVLRIASSNVQIWTHFDLYDNILCQTVGRKRVILIGPDETQYLYIKGDKSPVNNFDDHEQCVREFPLIARAKLYKVHLEPRDALYIPALWWHNIRTIPEDDRVSGYSIGFNIFWRDKNIETHYAIGDVYGNKNLKPFDAALTNIDKALKHIEQLPAKYKRFHQLMLLERLKARFLEDIT